MNYMLKTSTKYHGLSGYMLSVHLSGPGQINTFFCCLNNQLNDKHKLINKEPYKRYEDFLGHIIKCVIW